MKGTRRIVALAGLSGAGKTTLIKAANQRAKFTHLSASELIKEYKKTQGSSATSEQLRMGDIQDNQTQLIRAFEDRAATIAGDIILDCHTLIDTPSGLQTVPVETFKAIGITEIVFLFVEPSALVARREADSSRSRPNRSAMELHGQQETARSLAIEISQRLNIPFTDIRSRPKLELEKVLHEPDSR